MGILSLEEKKTKVKKLKEKVSNLKKSVDYNNAMQLSLKLVLNGSYGALTTQYFILFNNHVAGSITAEGRELTKTMSNVNEDYWYNHWHLDYTLHERMKINEVDSISPTESTSVYGDSITGDSIIQTDIGYMTIESIYNESCTYNGSRTTDGKEVVATTLSSLNWTEGDGFKMSDVKNVIRHKVSKKKWCLTSSCSESIVVTNDHSMVVFRDGVKLIVKPSEIKETDKVLIYSDEINNLSNIESVECIGDFENEYVYDLEMSDKSHTFIANNILIHNTDSIFVGFKPALDSCKWKDQIFNEEFLSSYDKTFIIIKGEDVKLPSFENSYFKGSKSIDIKDDEYDYSYIEELIKRGVTIFIDGAFTDIANMNKFLKDYDKFYYNWDNEMEFIHGIDKFKISDFFITELDKHANSYGVENVQNFELEKISESIINIAKKKYIQHILWEEGIEFDRLTYYQPKGVELVRSSTPLFARDKIPKVIEYLFSKPDTFNIKELLSIIKGLRKEFELGDIDAISMQSSCNKYKEKVIDDKDKLTFVSGAHFGVKAAAHHNFLLYNEESLHTKYEYLKSGDKIKYYYCNNELNPIFAFKRGEFPIEIAPDIDYDTQFQKAILSPINSVIKPLGLPLINKRLSVVMDIFGSI